MNYYIKSLMSFIVFVILSGCGSSNLNEISFTDREKVLADNNVVSSIAQVVYDDTFKVTLMRITGGVYNNDIGFWMRYTCDSNCENRAYKIYIDSDNDKSTGYQMEGIGADYSVGSDGYYTWQKTLWVPDLFQRTHFQSETVGNEIQVLAYDAGTDFFFKRSMKAVFSIDSASQHLLHSPMIQINKL